MTRLVHWVRSAADVPQGRPMTYWTPACPPSYADVVKRARQAMSLERRLIAAAANGAEAVVESTLAELVAMSADRPEDAEAHYRRMAEIARG